MLYLEDYIEMIEHLPQELRDRFTEMREIDLGVQNSKDRLEKKVEVFFSNARTMKPHEKEAEYQVIRKEYDKTLEDADKKMYLANQMYDLVDRYVRRLDQEIHEFKIHLEAKNKGITEILEKRSLELDQPTNSSQKENRYKVNSSRSQRSNSSHSRGEKGRDSKGSSNSIEKRVAVQKISMPSSKSSDSSDGLPEPKSASSDSCSRIPQASLIPSAATAQSAGTSTNKKKVTSTCIPNVNVLSPAVQQLPLQQQQQQQEQRVEHQHQQHQQ